MKTGLFFGTFNPVHVGHLIIAESALNALDLQRIWFIVSPHNPFKDRSKLAGEVDRLRMVELAIENNPKLKASNVEFRLPKPSYTIDTLTHLQDAYRENQFSIIMGEDNLNQLPKWKNYEAILNHYTIYAYPRPGIPLDPPFEHPSVIRFDMPRLDISATTVRQMVREKKSIRYLVPDAVMQYIDEKGLYAN